ncbi:hypothetical protein GD429_13260 [Burkholderia sp. BE17]|nr:hypothetical protein [Burkholderia sp. BE17]
MMARADGRHIRSRMYGRSQDLRKCTPILLIGGSPCTDIKLQPYLGDARTTKSLGGVHIKSYQFKEPIRTVADGLEWSYGWEAAAAQRLRFVLDLAYEVKRARQMRQAFAERA